jgi:predicted GNAT family acetyltransferase
MSTINHDPATKRLTTEVDGHTGELDYTVNGSVMNITHTRVPPAIGGRGVAAGLMRAALELAADRGWSVNPVCSYAVAYLKRHADKRHHLEDLLDEALDESYPASDPPAAGGVS